MMNNKTQLLTLLFFPSRSEKLTKFRNRNIRPHPIEKKCMTLLVIRLDTG